MRVVPKVPVERPLGIHFPKVKGHNQKTPYRVRILGTGILNNHDFKAKLALEPLHPQARNSSIMKLLHVRHHSESLNIAVF